MKRASTNARQARGLVRCRGCRGAATFSGGPPEPAGSTAEQRSKRQRLVAAIGAAGKQRRWEAALALLQDAKTLFNASGPPDQGPHQAALDACSRAMEWARAMTLLEEMAKSKMFIDKISCTSAMTACDRASRWPIALKLFTSLACRPPGYERHWAGPRQNSGVLHPDHMTYSVAISACGKGSHWTVALEILKEAQSDSRLRLRQEPYGAAITACGKAQRWADALEVLGSLESQQVIPGQVSFGAAAEACTSSARLDKAMELVQTMRLRLAYLPLRGTRSGSWASDSWTILGGVCSTSVAAARLSLGPSTETPSLASPQLRASARPAAGSRQWPFWMNSGKLVLFLQAPGA